VRAQRGTLTDGARLVHPPGEEPGNRLVRRLRTGLGHQSRRPRGDGRDGIDISREFSKPWTDEFVLAADVVITMGCGDACPLPPGKHYEDWELDDPVGKTLEEIRPIRNEIRDRVSTLIEKLASMSEDAAYSPICRADSRAEFALTKRRSTGHLPAETARASTSFTIFEGASSA